MHEYHYIHFIIILYEDQIARISFIMAPSGGGILSFGVSRQRSYLERRHAPFLKIEIYS